jgi:hypothetical protein
MPRRCTLPTARWPIVGDNPNIHLSESVVRPVARVCRLKGMLGVDGSVCWLKGHTRHISPKARTTALPPTSPPSRLMAQSD